MSFILPEIRTMSLLLNFYDLQLQSFKLKCIIFNSKYFMLESTLEKLL